MSGRPAAKKAAPAKDKKSEPYVVAGTHSLIQVQIGAQVLQYSSGDVLPDGVDEDSLKHLVDNGLVQKGEVVIQSDDAESDSSDDE